MSKVLWLGDAGATTGFATATHAITDRLIDKGHEVSCLAVNYRGDTYPTRMRLFMPTLLQGHDIHGMSRVVEVLAETEPDVVVMLNDPLVQLNMLFNNDYDTEKILLRYRPLIGYTPVDGYDMPKYWAVLGTVTRQVAMSKFGQDSLPGSELIYHGVDTVTFHPVSEEEPLSPEPNVRILSKRQAKEYIGVDPDAFFVLRVDANSWRKDYASTWKALQAPMRRHKDIEVHFHCAGSDKQGGVKMPALWSRAPETAERFHLPNPETFNTFKGWSKEHLATLYNAADLFVSTTMGEGFGLTLAEAAACGVPIVAQAVSAVPEVVGPGGIIVKKGFAVTAPGGQDMYHASIDRFSEAVEFMYTHTKDRQRMGNLARQHALTFSWDDAADKFDALITELHARSTSGEAKQEVSQ